MYVKSVKRGAVVFLLLLTIFLVNSVMLNAFGLSTPFMKDETLRVNPGKMYAYTVTLQNNDAQEYYVDITYSSTEDIARLEKTEYYVPAYTYNITFSFLMEIPETAKIGQTYALEYAAKPRVNGSETVSMGVEIKRGITILVTDKETNSVMLEDQIFKEQKRIDIDWRNIGKYILLILIVIAAGFMVLLVWRLSKRITSKLSEEERTGYTISEAMNLDEVKKLLKNINDEAYDVSEIKNLFKEKLSELTTNDVAHRMHNMTRKELIREIDKIKK